MAPCPRAEQSVAAVPHVTGQAGQFVKNIRQDYSPGAEAFLVSDSPSVTAIAGVVGSF